MPNLLPPLRAVQVFEAAGRHLNFSAAAEELFISQSAISHQIRILEDFLGESLFIRQGRSVVLTGSGDLYLQEVQQSLGLLTQATAQMIGQPERGLRLSVYSSLALKWLVPKLHLFRARHPEIDLELKMVAEERPELSDRIADVFITSYPKKSGYSQRLIHEEYLVAVCSPRIFSQLDRNNLSEDMWRFPQLETEDNEWQTWCDATGVILPRERLVHRFSHTVMALEAAVYDQGIALVSAILVQDELAKGRLVQLELAPQLAGFSLYLCTKQRRLQDANYQALALWLNEMLPLPETLLANLPEGTDAQGSL